VFVCGQHGQQKTSFFLMKGRLSKTGQKNSSSRFVLKKGLVLFCCSSISSLFAVSIPHYAEWRYFLRFLAFFVLGEEKTSKVLRIKL